MTDAAEYRNRAKECIDIARKHGPETRPLLLCIAEAWLALAHAAEDAKRAGHELHEGDTVH